MLKELNVIVFASTEIEMCHRLAGIFLGIVLGLFYIHYAWYQRGPETLDTRKHIKIKGLGVFSVVTGGPALLGNHYQAIQQFTSYTLVGGMVIVPVLIVGMVLVAYRSAYDIAFVPAEARRIALKCASEAFFKGWPYAQAVMDDKMLYVHAESKCRLVTLMHDTHMQLTNLPSDSTKKVNFVSNFKAVVGMTLYHFFQHKGDTHPDFCASYYQYTPENTREPLQLVVRITGGGDYHAQGATKLEANSIAMECLNRRQMILYPGDKQRLGIGSPHPPMRNRKIKHFLLIPVPFSEQTDKPLGVFCVDTCKKDAWQLRDEFHLTVLKWCTSVICELHENYLK